MNRPLTGLLYFATARIPSRTANSIQIMRMCEGFGRTGCRVELVLPMSFSRVVERHLLRADPFKYYGVAPLFSLHRLWVPRIWNMYTFMSAAKAKFSNQLIYTRHLELAALLVKWKIPVCFEAHDLRSTSSTGAAAWLRQYACQPELLGIIAISARLKEHLLLAGYPAEKLLVAHDGVDLQRFRPVVSRLDARIQSGLNPGATYVGYVGSLYHGRGIEMIVACATHLPEYNFLVVGGSEAEVSHWRTQVHSYALNNIEFTGHISQDATTRYLFASDVLLMPYTNKVTTMDFASPLKMFEYMASERPIVASDFPVLREVLHQDENALLVPADDAHQWVAAIRQICQDQNLANRLSTQANADVLRYSWDQRATDILDFLVNRANVAGYRFLLNS